MENVSNRSEKVLKSFRKGRKNFSKGLEKSRKGFPLTSMSHDIAQQIERFFAKYHNNDKTFLKKLYCDPVFREITRYKETIHKYIIEGKRSCLQINNSNLLYSWNQTDNTRLWIDLKSGTILENYPQTNNPVTNNPVTNDPTIIPLYFHNEFEKKALIQLTTELDLKIIQLGAPYNIYYVLSWKHWTL